MLLISYLQGSSNYISHNWTWTTDYICSFQYQWYPFDTQSCQIHYIAPDPNIWIRLTSMKYSGSNDLQKYNLKNMTHCQVEKNGRSVFYINFIISRPLTSNSLTMFLPTAMLLLISQMSTTFSNTYLEIVIEVNSTLLLVLTT